MSGTLFACASDPDRTEEIEPPPAEDGAIHPRFEPREGTLAWGAIPWPDDLYLSSTGRIAITDLEVGDSDYARALEEALGELDGFGTRPTARFAFDGPLEARSLPDPEASVQADSAVFLFDVDTSSPDAFTRLPIDVVLDADARTLLVRPAYGRTLQPGRRYAVVLTDALQGTRGRRVRRAPRFDAALDPDATTLDELEQRVRAEYSPVLQALEGLGIARSRVVGAAVFRVQDVDHDLDDARAIVQAGELSSLRVERIVRDAALDRLLGSAPSGGVGLEPGRGVAHEHIAALVDLAVTAPTLGSVAQGARAPFRRDAEGALIAGALRSLPCSLAIPRSNAGGAALPVVMMQHGWGGDRSDALALANELAAAGHAVLSCDAPLHGSRGPVADEHNRFTDRDEPDGFGDGFGDLLGNAADEGVLVPLHPFYYRDAMRQSVVEWMAIVRALREGAWDVALAAQLGDAGFALARDDFGFVGIDLGAEIATALGGIEPSIGACVLAFAGGHTVDDWLSAPGYAPFASALEARLGSSDPAWTRADLDVLRTLLDRASGSAYAPRLRRSATNVLMLIAVDDELVPNATTEAIAYGAGAALVDAEPRFEPDLMVDLVLQGGAIVGNVELRAGSVTRVAQSFEPATHDALVSSEGRARFEREPPFAELDEPEAVANPTSVALDQIVFFFESYRACRAADPSIACAASVSSLSDPTR